MCDHRNKGQAVPAEGCAQGPLGSRSGLQSAGRGGRGWPQDRLPWRPLGMASRPPRSSDTYLLEGRKWALSPTWASLALQLHDSAFTPSLCPCLSCPPQKPALSGPPTTNQSLWHPSWLFQNTQWFRAWVPGNKQIQPPILVLPRPTHPR